jgi:hypothetical protein
MENLSKYELVYHSEDEHLKCFGWSFWTDFIDILYNGDLIGRVCERTGEVLFEGNFFDSVLDGHVLPIELLAVYDDGVIVGNWLIGHRFVGGKKESE